MKYGFSDIKMPNWWSLEQEKREIEQGIFGLKRMIELNEDSVQKVNQTLDEKRRQFLDEIKDEDPEYKSNLEYYFLGNEDIHNWELERKQRASIILVLYSFFEGKLKSVCELIEKEFDFKIKLNDLKNNEDIQLYLTYLQKVFGFDLPPDTEKFLTPIKQHKIVRNIIAHQDSNFKKEQKRKIQVEYGLELVPNNSEKGFISIKSDKFAKHLLQNMEHFFNSLLEKLDIYYGNIINKG